MFLFKKRNSLEARVRDLELHIVSLHRTVINDRMPSFNAYYRFLKGKDQGSLDLWDLKQLGPCSEQPDKI